MKMKGFDFYFGLDRGRRDNRDGLDSVSVVRLLGIARNIVGNTTFTLLLGSFLLPLVLLCACE